VFSTQIYKLYAYHIFWARVEGSLIWACFSSKIPNAAPYPRSVNRSIEYFDIEATMLKNVMIIIKHSDKGLECNGTFSVCAYN
jgi:hypothetical protein